MKEESKQRLAGKVDEVVGAVQKGVGRAVGDHSLEAEGTVREAGGQVRQEKAKAVGRTRGVAQQVAGKVKATVGAVTGDESLEAEGRVEDAEGKLRRKANQ